MMKKVLNGVSVQMFIIRLTAVLLGVTILSGCSYHRTGFETSNIVVQEPKEQFKVEPDMEISLTPISGNLFVRGIDGSNAVLSMEVTCPGITGKCADHFEDLEFEINRVGNKMTIGANKGTMSNGDSGVNTILDLPRVDLLKLIMNAGDVNISGVFVNRLYVDMTAGNIEIDVNQLETLQIDLFAGDLDIKIPEHSVAEVDLDAGVGDASIKRLGRIENAPRSFLIGAQMRKQISEDGAIIRADVQFGDIAVNLTP